jgi:glutamate-ammonia-ligase adenylyltransferase
LTLLSEAISAPEPYDPERAESVLGDLRSGFKSVGAEPDATTAPSIDARPEIRRLLEGAFGNSPFLGHLALRDADFLRSAVVEDIDALFERVLDDTSRAAGEPRPALMTELRRQRGRAALLIALADIAGLWPAQTVVGALSRFAEAAISAAVDHLLREAAAAGDIVVDDPALPGPGSGFVAMAMGKLGAGELNYSSDIDLLLLFDQDIVRYTGARTTQDCFIRMTRSLVQILQDRTGDGYVFRVDLRLRPDTGSSPIAMSMAAAETYYESVGQNWERAALIKARPVAGDRAAGLEFLERVRPFIWRKYLDFAAIEDIHSIKRQIHAHRGHHTVSVAGHNIKLGRGGIREIEFFVQTQQLIAGGRDPSLRVSDTCRGLSALVDSGRLDATVARELTDAYWYLRTLEHRLQMIADEQTQTLPEDADGMARIAVFMGYRGTESFSADLLDRLRSVERHYAKLFENAPALGGSGVLVFTGTDDDPGTIRTLTELGYLEPSTAAGLVRSWHHGRYRAMRSSRARELLTELTPTLLGAFARSPNPDAAILKFDEFLGKLPAGVQLFSLFYANPQLLDLVAEIMGSAPRLAEHLARNPRLLDNVLSTGFDKELPGIDRMKQDLDELFATTRFYEETLDVARRWGHDQFFQVGTRILRGLTDTVHAGPALSDVADTLVDRLFDRTSAEFASQHGRIVDGSFAILAFGKYGSRELTPESDLDLMFVYQSPPDARESDGERPLTPSEYYARLSRRVINSLTALTGEGSLYEVDMRLRPSGNSGPIAMHVDGFEAYERDSAWTWEHMALTRTRVVLAPPALRERLAAFVGSIVSRPRDPDKLRAEVIAMRQRIWRERGTDDSWNVKHVRGGLIDLEFLCQYLILANANAAPGIVDASTSTALRRMGPAGILDPEIANDLGAATDFQRNVQGFLRLTVIRPFSESDAPAGLKAALARAARADSFDQLKERLLATQASVRRVFEEILGPAAD